MGDLLIIRLLFIAVLTFAAYFLHPFNLEGPIAAGVGVVAAIAVAEEGDISASEIRKFFGGTTRSRAGHRPHASRGICAAG